MSAAFWQSLDWTKRDCEIASETGKNRSAVARWRKHLGHPIIPAERKLSPEQVKEAREMQAAGKPKPIIAMQFRVSTRTIQRALNNGYKESARVRARYLEFTNRIKAPIRCQMCGGPRYLEKHHADYSFPDEVIWVCQPCHRIADTQRKNREQSQPKAA